MNKQRLLSWLQDPSSFTSGDAKKLDDLLKEYPFFSIGYALNAKIKKEEESPDAKQALGTAALYTADRHVLKLFLSPPPKLAEEPTSPITEKTEETLEQKTDKADTSPAEEPQETKEEAETDETPPEITSSNIRRIVFTDEPNENQHLEDSFYEEVENNLKNLKAQKSALNMWMRLHEHDLAPEKQPTNEVDNPTKKETSTPTENIPIETTDNSAEEPQSVQPPPIPPNDNPIAEEPNEVASDNNSKDLPVPPPLPTDLVIDPPTVVSLPEDEGIEPANSENWQKEQAEMIDRFLAEEKNLKKKGELGKDSNNSNQVDLSLKSQEFGDNIISENLARILTKQGKTERAVEIYRKLIWKFPQKRSYFADLIEQLKDSE